MGYWERGIWSTAQRALHINYLELLTASTEAFPSDVGGPACVGKVRQLDGSGIH